MKHYIQAVQDIFDDIEEVAQGEWKIMTAEQLQDTFVISAIEASVKLNGLRRARKQGRLSPEEARQVQALERREQRIDKIIEAVAHAYKKTRRLRTLTT